VAEPNSRASGYIYQSETGINGRGSGIQSET
jgi:hypothetical protein